ncbi:PAS domain S-box protein [Martelella lutilitoris]|uniref:histidine kinase n=1 Tax=Martelella lutilitoris TaxID=2583532 RepID=A0A5C4JVN7_9HYPH|nr:PAS domain S-box protein [Martelella lutilitoris]TNB49211.1 PAS domain S-box protein [Martelella lutilitoris]
MSTAVPHYLAFATHPALRGRFLKGRAMLAVDPETRSVAFANAAGAGLLGHAQISEAIGTSADAAILLRQFMAAADPLSAPGDSRDFAIPVTQRFRRVSKPATASLFVLDGRRYLLMECEAASHSDKATDLVSGFGESEAHLAVIDEEGACISASSGFSRTGLQPEDLRPIIESLTVGPESHTERLAATETGIWPLALGRLSKNPPRFLLFVSEELADEVNAIVDAVEEEAPMAPESGRSPREAIAAIDESLGALVARQEQAEQTSPRQSPVVRKQPAQPEVHPAQALETERAEADIRRPLRFVWRTDGAGRITDVSGELAEAVGPQMAEIIGLRFAEIESRLGVKGADAISRLLQSADTWSGRTVEWPVSDTDMIVPVDLAALPTYTRERRFDGFRGFGLVRLGEESANPDAAPAARPTASQAKAAPKLTEDERHALDEIASQLRSADAGTVTPETAIEPVVAEHKPSPVIKRKTQPPQPDSSTATDGARIDASRDAIVVQTGERVLHANPAFLSLSGYGSLDAVIDAGGPDAFVERGDDDRLFLRTADGGRLPVSFHLQAISWQGARALALTLRPEHADGDGLDAPVTLEQNTWQDAPSKLPSDGDVAELHAILDTSTDGILILDEKRHIRSISGSASALFGVESQDVIGEDAGILFAEESHGDLETQVNRLLEGRGGDVMPEGLEVIGREAGGGLIPLFITLGRLPQSGGVCAILRDVTSLKRREEDLRAARREAREAEEERDTVRSALRYELRQPLDAIISLSETMDHQPFGTLGDNRYHALAREIAAKSRQARTIVGRLLGEPEPEETTPPPAEPETPPAHEARKPAPLKESSAHETAQINEAVAEAVSLVQPRANARRIIIRAALSPTLAKTPCDTDALKEMAFQLLQGAVQFTPAGGQVVVSTAVSASGETVLRFRDNGIAPNRRRSAGARGDGKEAENQHLLKARQLAEGLGARFLVHAVPSEGMLVEVFLPVKTERPLHY